MSLLQKYFIADDGIFPNSKLPVLFYPGILSLPAFFAPVYIKNLFRNNGWSNAWKNGIYSFHHYHSNTHEVLGVYRGNAILQLGGEKGKTLEIKRGDVLIIPAGVAHKNLSAASNIKCIGAYPDGMQYNIRLGKTEDRPADDLTIENVPKPVKDPVRGSCADSLVDNWQV